MAGTFVEGLTDEPYFAANLESDVPSSLSESYTFEELEELSDELEEELEEEEEEDEDSASFMAHLAASWRLLRCCSPCLAAC